MVTTATTYFLSFSLWLYTIATLQTTTAAAITVTIKAFTTTIITTIAFTAVSTAVTASAKNTPHVAS